MRNKAYPEGSIIEAYRIEELVYFCSRYFDLKVQTKFSRPERNDDGGEVEQNGRLSIFTQSGRKMGKGRIINLSDEELNSASLYVLSNCDEVYEYIE